MSFFAELKRRNVFRVGIAYVVGGWLLLQFTEVLSELLNLPEEIGPIVVAVVAIGFPIVLFAAWAFELTPEGIKREHEVDRSQSITPQTGRRLDRTIIALLVLALGYFIWESRFAERRAVDDPEPLATTTTPAVADEAPASPELDAPEAIGDIDQKSIAVLPFTNRSPNQDDIYFTDGVHDDLLTQLAKIGAFSVISRTSVMEYRDSAKNLKEIAAELGVANVMEGAVQRAGNRVRINVQLIDATTDEHLWAEVYDRQLTTENLFDIQSEIAQAIAGAMHATLSDSEIANVSEAPTDSVEAYDFYMQARRFGLGQTEIGFDTAIELYEAALELDPGFKLAWTGLAGAHITNYWSYGADPEDLESARAAIDRARNIDPDFPELHIAEGFYWYWGHLDYERAIDFLERAVRQMPGNAEAHMALGWASRRAGQWEQAVTAMDQAVRLDPRVVINLVEYSQTLAYLGRMEQAWAVADQVYALNPDNFWSKTAVSTVAVMANADVARAARMMTGAQHTGDPGFTVGYVIFNLLAREQGNVLQVVERWDEETDVGVNAILTGQDIAARALDAAGRKEEARRAAAEAIRRIESLAETIPYDYRHSEALARMHGILGNREEVSRLASETLATKPNDAVRDPQIRYTLAIAQAQVGMTGEALEQLAEVLGMPGSINANYMRVDPELDVLREHPDFQALLERYP